MRSNKQQDFLYMDDNLRNEENIPWKTFPGKHSLDTVKVKVQDESGNFF